MDRPAASAGDRCRRRVEDRSDQAVGAAQGRRRWGPGTGDRSFRCGSACRAAGGRRAGAQARSRHRVSGRAGTPRLGAQGRQTHRTGRGPGDRDAGDTRGTRERTDLRVARDAVGSRHCLPSVEHRGEIDARLATRPGGLEALGDGQTSREARRLAYELDPASVMRRVRGAESDRRVTIRPAPDTMSLVSGFLPVAQGVAVHAALTRTADTLKAQGDERSRGQIMADEFVTRITGQSAAAAVPTRVELVMSDTTMFGGGETPALVQGYGPIPAALARRLIGNPRAGTWLRRLYTSPDRGSLVAMDARSRRFPPSLKDLLVARDQTCRTPWCDAPIRHAEHVVSSAAGGSTSHANGQGLCEACNQAKQAPGWRSQTDGGFEIEVRTPTGHAYRSRPPPLPGAEAKHQMLARSSQEAARGLVRTHLLVVDPKVIRDDPQRTAERLAVVAGAA